MSDSSSAMIILTASQWWNDKTDALTRNADVIVGLYRESYYNRKYANLNAAEAIVLKNRKGDTGTVNLMFLAEYTTYVSVDRKHE